MFVKLAARLGFVVPVIVVLGQVPAFDFAILALGALLSRRTFGYLSPQQQKKKQKGAPRWFWKVSLFSLEHVQRGARGEKIWMLLHLTFSWSGCAASNVIRFGFVLVTWPPAPKKDFDIAARSLQLSWQWSANSLHSPFTERKRERHWEGELWRGTRNQIKFAKLFVIWVSEREEEEPATWDTWPAGSSCINSSLFPVSLSRAVVPYSYS